MTKTFKTCTYCTGKGSRSGEPCPVCRGFGVGVVVDHFARIASSTAPLDGVDALIALLA